MLPTTRLSNDAQPQNFVSSKNTLGIESKSLEKIKKFVKYIFKQIHMWFMNIYNHFFSSQEVVNCSVENSEELDKILEEALRDFELNEFDEQNESTISISFDVDQKDQEKINKLLEALSEGEYYSLLYRQQELKSLGCEIDKKVDPLSFLAFIVNASKDKLRRILNRAFIGKEFLDGASKKLQAYHEEKNISGKLDSYSAVINVPKSLLETCIKENNWNRFIRLVAGLDD